MRQPSKFILSAIVAIFLCTNFQCGDPECEYYYVLRDWQPNWIDNSGSEPRLSVGPVPRAALGIRIAAQMSNTGLDTLLIDPAEGCFVTPVEPITQLEVLAIDDFDNVTAGANINDRFMLRVSDGARLKYVPMTGALSALNAPPTRNPYQIDLLMTTAPTQPGVYRFLVKVGFDSLRAFINRDTSFILPPITLQ